MALVETIPFGEFLVLLVAVGIALLVLNVARRGETIIYELDEAE